MEQLLEKQGDGEAGVNSEERGSGLGDLPQDPQTRSPLSLKFPNVSRVLPLDPTPALTLANLSLTVSPF